ncbi:MAG: hypothetical protein KZQ92_10795 [Candidatus Thiodiazotropha sp. (ex Lucinoma borealis)]|nr:hypothetical protein [Candidatus Thiodiazotropha sp. (ex Lucinoma borealis)]
MRRPSSRQRRLVILILAVATFCIAFYAGVLQKDRNKRLPQINGVLINPPTPSPTLNLLDQNGEAFSAADLLGHWSLLMWDPQREVNPTPALVQLIQVHNRMATNPELQQQIHYLYLPRHEIAEVTKSLSELGSNIHGLSGEALKLDEAFHLFGSDDIGAEYTLYLIGPEGLLHALFTQTVDAATIAEDLTKMITFTQ